MVNKNYGNNMASSVTYTILSPTYRGGITPLYHPHQQTVDARDFR